MEGWGRGGVGLIREEELGSMWRVGGGRGGQCGGVGEGG